jgi:hypothetical protein
LAISVVLWPIIIVGMVISLVSSSVFILTWILVAVLVR